LTFPSFIFSHSRDDDMVVKRLRAEIDNLDRATSHAQVSFVLSKMLKEPTPGSLICSDALLVDESLFLSSFDMFYLEDALRVPSASVTRSATQTPVSRRNSVSLDLASGLPYAHSRRPSMSLDAARVASVRSVLRSLPLNTQLDGAAVHAEFVTRWNSFFAAWKQQRAAAMAAAVDSPAAGAALASATAASEHQGRPLRMYACVLLDALCHCLKSQELSDQQRTQLNCILESSPERVASIEFMQLALEAALGVRASQLKPLPSVPITEATFTANYRLLFSESNDTNQVAASFVGPNGVTGCDTSLKSCPIM
jgi:hypothetical protein